MTLEKNHDDTRTRGMPAPDQLPTGPRTAVSAAVARRLFRAAVARLDVTVVEAPTGRTFGRGGPLMRLHRPVTPLGCRSSSRAPRGTEGGPRFSGRRPGGSVGLATVFG